MVRSRGQITEKHHGDENMKHAPAKEFRDLILWQKAHALVLFVYSLSRTFPKHELYGLTSQIRRAAVSVPANIAEGFKKRTVAEKIRYLNISQSSLEECRYFLILVEDLGYAETEGALDRLEEVSKILESYIKGIKRNHD
jgi:four helix bundle protein